jgi:hypothetical protein
MAVAMMLVRVVPMGCGRPESRPSRIKRKTCGLAPPSRQDGPVVTRVIL